MLSFELKEGGNELLNHVLRRLRWFTLAESLGGVESLLSHPPTMTHASVPAETRAQRGLDDQVVGNKYRDLIEFAGDRHPVSLLHFNHSDLVKPVDWNNSAVRDEIVRALQ